MCQSPANKHMSIPVNLLVEKANSSGHCLKYDKSVARQRVNLLTSQDLALINKMSDKSSESFVNDSTGADHMVKSGQQLE